MAKKDKPSREKKKPPKKKAKAKPKPPAEPVEQDEDSNPETGHEEEGDGDENLEEETAAHLPDKKNAPKRSGPKGIQRLDPVEDFEKPVRKEGEEAVAELDKPKAKGSLLADNPPKPTVANGRMKVFYDKPVTTKVKDKILIALACTVALEKEHDELLPKIIANAHREMRKGVVGMKLTDIPSQTVSFYHSSDAPADGSLLEIPACRLIQTNLAIVQRKGEGSTRSVVRLALRFQAVRSDALMKWATLNLQNEFWIEMEETQTALWDEDDEEE